MAKSKAKPVKKTTKKGAKKVIARATKKRTITTTTNKKPIPKITATQNTQSESILVQQESQQKKQGYTKEELEHFKKIILERRQEILEELESLKASMMDVTTGQYEIENSTYSLHMEQGTDAMEREKTFLFASREGKFLNYLDDALRRIEKGEYGYCTECGNLIDKERLEAVPHAHLCVQCKLKKK
ncbi:MAG: TraR/DksA family transcriptional regulator [Bacteroidetes bacterium]|nr:TraR/DksA family transcriptional regulator [Bacteroidota bacterium]